MSKNDYIPVKTSDEAQKLATDIYSVLQRNRNGFINSMVLNEETYFVKHRVMPFLTGEREKKGKSLDNLLSKLGDPESPRVKELKDDLLIEIVRKIEGSVGEEKKSYLGYVMQAVDLIKNQTKKNQFCLELAHRYSGRLKKMAAEGYDYQIVNAAFEYYARVKPQTPEESKMLEQSLEANEIAEMAKLLARHNAYELAAKAYAILGQGKKVDLIESLYSSVQGYITKARKKKPSSVKMMLRQAQDRLREGDVEHALNLFRLCDAAEIVRIIEEQQGKKVDGKDDGLQGIVKNDDKESSEAN